MLAGAKFPRAVSERAAEYMQWLVADVAISGMGGSGIGKLLAKKLTRTGRELPTASRRSACRTLTTG